MISKIIANTRKHGQLTRVESLVCSILIAIVSIDAFEDPKFQLLPKDIGVLVGSTVDFTCSIINPGAINSILDKTIKWCKNGYPVRTGILPGTPSGLHIVNIQPTDEYGCGIDGFLCKETTKLHFVTALSITTSTTATTTTALPSQVTVDLSPSKSTIYDQDKSVSLTCTVTSPATTTLTISWYRDAFQLDHTSSRVKTTPTTHSGTIFTGTLTFNTIYHRDMGNYFCKVSEDGHVGTEKNLQLTVFYRPIVQISPLTSSIDTRSPVYLTCRVANLKEIEKNADVSLEWCKNGHSLTLSGGETFTTKERGHEVLEVRRVTADVTYSCGVEGCNSIAANVFVLKPNTPTCPQSDDQKSNTWNHTKAGETMYKVCPVAYVGNISRECHTDSSWGDLKDINCVNKTLLSLFDRLENINESLEPTDVIDPTLKQLYRFVSDKAKLITAGDLNMVVNILQKIADIMNETKYIVQQLTSLNFMRTVAEILSLGKEPDWSQVHREIDPMKAATLMNIVKTFGLSVGRHINKSIDFTTNTFALQINKTHPETITLSPNNAHTPTLTVSKNSLTNAAASLGGDRELLVLTAVYNTLHRFLNAQVNSPGSMLKNPHGQKLAPPLFSVSVYIYFNSSMKEVTDMKPSVTMTAPLIRRVKQMCCIQTENSTFICPAEPKDGVCEYSITGNLAITQEAVEDLVIMATKIVIGIIMVYIILLSIGNIYILRYLQLSDAKNVTMLFAFGIFTFGSTSAENLERCQTIGVFLTFFFVTTGFLSCSSSILMLINMRQNVGNTKVNQAPVDKLNSPEEEQEVLQGKQIGPKTCVNANCALQLGMTLGSYGLSAFIVGTYVGVMTSEGFVTDTKCLPSVKNGAVYILVCPMCTMLLLQVFFSIISDVCSSKEGNKSEEKNSESKGEKRCVGRRCMAITEGLEQFLEIFGIVWAALTDDYIDVCTTICTFILAISKGVRDAPILNEIRKRMNKKFRLCRTKKDESDKERKKVEDIEMEVKGKENPDVVDKGNIDIGLPISENTSFGPSSAPVDSVMYRM